MTWNENHINLSPRLLEFINGELLGDGCLYIPDKKYAKSAQYQHSSKYKEYLEWLDYEISKFGLLKCKIRKQLQKSFGKEYITYHYTSKSYRELITFREKWYSNGKKIVPKNLELTPITVRQWYLGDGNLRRYNRSINIIPQIKLFTYAYSLDEVDNLINKLNEIGIKCNKLIQKKRENGGSGPFIYINTSSVIKFFRYIGDCPEEIKDIYGYKWPTLHEYSLMDRKECKELHALKTYKNKKWLQNKYLIERLTTREIAKICYVAKSTIINQMKKFNINRRKNTCRSI